MLINCSDLKVFVILFSRSCKLYTYCTLHTVAVGGPNYLMYTTFGVPISYSYLQPAHQTIKILIVLLSWPPRHLNTHSKYILYTRAVLHIKQFVLLSIHFQNLPHSPAWQSSRPGFVFCSSYA